MHTRACVWNTTTSLAIESTRGHARLRRAATLRRGTLLLPTVHGIHRVLRTYVLCTVSCWNMSNRSVPLCNGSCRLLSTFFPSQQKYSQWIPYSCLFAAVFPKCGPDGFPPHSLTETRTHTHTRARAQCETRIIIARMFASTADAIEVDLVSV